MLFENQKEPTSLSEKGKWSSGKKSDILDCLTTFSCDVSMESVDAAAIVHIWSEPLKLQTSYVECHFLPFVQSMISESTITTLDLIWVSYLDQSLTRLTQEKRACRTKVKGSTPIETTRK